MDLIEKSTFERQTLRQAFGCFPTGVTAFCGLVDGLPDGMAASSFTAVSMDPPLVSVCVQNSSATWARLSTLSHIGLSVLARGHREVARSLSGPQGDRFADVAWSASDSGAVFIDESPLHLECTIDSVVTAGDHQLVLLQIESLTIAPGIRPLVFHASTFFELAPPA